MVASDGLTCTECGHTVRREQALYRSRRRRAPILTAVALLPVIVLLFLAPGVRRHGWVSALPDSVLMRFAGTSDSEPDLYDHELRRRITDGLLATRHYMTLLRNEREDGSPPWTITVRTRDRWPEGVPVQYDVDFDRPPLSGPSWMWTLPLGLSVMPPSGRGQQVHADFQGTSSLHLPDSVASLPPGRHEISFDVSVVLVGAAGAAAIWQDTLTHAFEVGGAVEDVIEVVEDPPLAEHFRRSITVHLRRGNPYVRGTTRLAALGRPVTFGGQLDLLRDGEVVWGCSIWRDRSGVVQWIDRVGLPPGKGPVESFDGGRWSLRYRSDPALALRHLDATHFWVGDFTLPAQVVDGETLRPEPAD